MNKARNILSLICNIVFFAITFCISVCSLAKAGTAYLVWFTTLSNMLCALGCAAVIPFNIKALRSETGALELPRGVALFKFAGTVAVTVTMVTVLTFLNFLVGLPRLLADYQLYLHLVDPIIAILTCCAFERIGKGIPRKQWLWGMLPLAIYSIVYLVMVLAVGPDNGGWHDFYGFNTIEGMWPISLVCMWAAAALLSFILWKLSGGKGRKKAANAAE